MRESIELLCLANSCKNEHRCLAGVRLDTGGWIRPVSTRDGGALTKERYVTKSGHTPTALDTVSVEIERPYPKYNQPENWIITDKQWKLIDTELNNQQLLSLNTALQRDGSIIFDESDKIAKNELKNGQTVQSLTVVEPQDPTFSIKKEKDQPRVTFHFDGTEYNMPITDPQWRNAVENGSVDQLPTADQVDDDKELLFTISLGEEYEGFCYKLVASIFTVKAEQLV